MAELVAGLAGGFARQKMEQDAEERANQYRLRYLQEASKLEGERQAAQQQRGFEHEARMRAGEELWKEAQRPMQEHKERVAFSLKQEEEKRNRRDELKEYADFMVRNGLMTPEQAYQWMKSHPELQDIFKSGTPSGKTAPTAPERREGGAGDIAETAIGAVGTALGLAEPKASETAPYGVEFAPQLPFWWQYKTAVESLQNLLGKPIGPGKKKTKNLSELIPKTPSEKSVLREARLRMP